MPLLTAVAYLSLPPTPHSAKSCHLHRVKKHLWCLIFAVFDLCCLLYPPCISSCCLLSAPVSALPRTLSHCTQPMSQPWLPCPLPSLAGPPACVSALAAPPSSQPSLPWHPPLHLMAWPLVSQLATCSLSHVSLYLPACACAHTHLSLSRLHPTTSLSFPPAPHSLSFAPHPSLFCACPMHAHSLFRDCPPTCTKQLELVTTSFWRFYGWTKWPKPQLQPMVRSQLVSVQSSSGFFLVLTTGLSITSHLWSLSPEGKGDPSSVLPPFPDYFWLVSTFL
jgi:hypothetical protein